MIFAHSGARAERAALTMGDVVRFLPLGNDSCEARYFVVRREGRMEKRKPTVLVVDDDEDICEQIADALTDEGYHPIGGIGAAVVRVAEERHPDVILLDVMMPVLNGADLSRLLRANPRTADIPIIAMSAMPRKSVPPGLRCDAWLGKPFDLTNMFVVIDALTAPAHSAN
jgi:CheY-like chemotaxis protein